MSNTLSTSKRLISFTNFNRGINTTTSFDELDQSELVTAVNIDLKARGGYTQRMGRKAHKSLVGSNNLPLVFPVSRLVDYPDKPLLVINKSLRDWDNNVITLLLSSNSLDYEFFTNSKLYLMDGTKYWVYNGTTCEEVTNSTSGVDLAPIKRCTNLIQRGQRMFAIGDPQNPNYLYYSEIGDPTKFLSSSVVKAVTDDNDILVGLVNFSDCLLAFKRHTIFKWSGWNPSADVEFSELDVGHGAISSSTICVTDDYLVFADDSGVYCLTTVEGNIIKSYYLSKNIEEIYRGLTNKDKMKAIVYQGNYYLACCNDGSGKNNLVLKASIGMAYNGSSDEGLSELMFPWVEYSGWDVEDWIVLNNKLYFGSSNMGALFECFNGINDESYSPSTGSVVSLPVSCEASHYLKLEDAVIRKKLKRLFLIALQDSAHPCTVRLDIEAGYVTYSKMVSLDESGAWDVGKWDEVMWDWVDTVIKEIRVGKKTTRLKLKISHSALDEKMTIYGFAAYYKTKKPRGSRNGISDITTV